VVFGAGGGFEDGINLFDLANSLWSYGLDISLPIFQGGYRRAELQRSWSAYRETVDRYRSTVLNAFREVENGFSLTNLLTAEVKKLESSVKAALETQNLTTNLYTGGLASSLELLFAQINTLDARIELVRAKLELARSSVELVRSLGGGWSRKQLPADAQIQPMGVFQYNNLGQPQPAAGVKVPATNNGRYNKAYDNLTQPAVIPSSGPGGLDQGPERNRSGQQPATNGSLTQPPVIPSSGPGEQEQEPEKSRSGQPAAKGGQ
jgi:hypothetical protein